MQPWDTHRPELSAPGAFPGAWRLVSRFKGAPGSFTSSPVRPFGKPHPSSPCRLPSILLCGPDISEYSHFCQINVAPTPAWHAGLGLCRLLLTVIFHVPSLILPFRHHWQPEATQPGTVWPRTDARLGHVLPRAALVSRLSASCG